MKHSLPFPAPSPCPQGLWLHECGSSRDLVEVGSHSLCLFCALLPLFHSHPAGSSTLWQVSEPPPSLRLNNTPIAWTAGGSGVRCWTLGLLDGLAVGSNTAGNKDARVSVLSHVFAPFGCTSGRGHRLLEAPPPVNCSGENMCLLEPRCVHPVSLNAGTHGLKTRPAGKGRGRLLTEQF